MTTSPTQKLVLISFNGLRPDFYLKKKYQTPFLKELGHSGAIAQSVLPVYPSLTYPCHATMMTGVTPNHHGILSNTKFSWKTGPSSDWYWKAACIQYPTLWEAAKSAGKKVAALRWPVTVGAQVDWLIPEIFAVHGHNDHEKSDLGRELELTANLTLQNSTPGLIPEIFHKKSDSPLQTFDISLAELNHYQWHDEWVTKAAIYILEKYQPDLTLIHLVQADKAQHDYGPDSLEVENAVHHLDSLIHKIANSINLKETCLMIVGDHGFISYSKMFKINTIFVQEGWITLDRNQLQDWGVIAHADGAHAAIYLKDSALKSKVFQVLEKNSHQIYKIIDRKTLDELGAIPDALCALEPLEDFTFSPELTGDPIIKLGRPQGQHGHLPCRPGIEAGFIAVGPGISPQTNLGQIHLLDLAPTLAEKLGVRFSINHSVAKRETSSKVPGSSKR